MRPTFSTQSPDSSRLSHKAAIRDCKGTKPERMRCMRLAVDGQVEQRQIKCLFSKLKSYADGPDISDSERSFLPDKLALFQGRRLCVAILFMVVSSTLVEDKGGSLKCAVIAIRPKADAHLKVLIDFGYLLQFISTCFCTTTVQLFAQHRLRISPKASQHAPTVSTVR